MHTVCIICAIVFFLLGFMVGGLVLHSHHYIGGTFYIYNDPSTKKKQIVAQFDRNLEDISMMKDCIMVIDNTIKL